MRTSDQIAAIAAALAKAQGEIGAAIKGNVNPAFRSRYADLAALQEAAKPALAANGLAVLQELTRQDAGVACTTRMMHSSGEWIELDPLVIPLAKADAHGHGSAATYARRYTYAAALQIPQEDDDGNAAAGVAAGKVEKPAPAVRDWEAQVKAAASVDALRLIYNSMTPDERTHYHDALSAAKAAILKADADAAPHP